MSTASEITIPFTGVCSSCKEQIPQGSVALHVQGTGLMHKSCHTTPSPAPVLSLLEEPVPEAEKFSVMEEIAVLAGVADKNLQENWPYFQALFGDGVLENLGTVLDAIQKIEKLAEKGEAPVQLPEPDVTYLRDLAERILKIPVMHGVDQGDYDRLRELANGDYSEEA
jgi:hypothetical protein